MQRRSVLESSPAIWGPRHLEDPRSSLHALHSQGRMERLIGHEVGDEQLARCTKLLALLRRKPPVVSQECRQRLERWHRRSLPRLGVEFSVDACEHFFEVVEGKRAGTDLFCRFVPSAPRSRKQPPL